MRRVHAPRAFLGEKLTVHLEVFNSGMLPAVWLRLRDSLPIELAVTGSFNHLISLGPKGTITFEYPVECRKRGYYPIGPLDLYTSDLFGWTDQLHRREPVDYLTVYPKIIPLVRLKIPSHSPMGTLRHIQPIFEDPTRILGKRDYVAGDSLRRVDWKATAVTHRLQVKVYEPSIALETALFLNLNASDYEGRARYDMTELAIVVAASLANYSIRLRQSVGLFTNGDDPIFAGESPSGISPRHGQAHLMQILETLARIQIGVIFSLNQLLEREIHRLAWGTTLIVISHQIAEDVFDQFFQARRLGMQVMLIVCGAIVNSEQIKQKAEFFGFPLVQVEHEYDLEMWR